MGTRNLDELKLHTSAPTRWKITDKYMEQPNVLAIDIHNYWWRLLTMTPTPGLKVRIWLKEALARVDDARCSAADTWTLSRLQLIARELEDTLTHLAPDPISLPRDKAPVSRRGRRPASGSPRRDSAAW